MPKSSVWLLKAQESGKQFQFPGELLVSFNIYLLKALKSCSLAPTHKCMDKKHTPVPQPEQMGSARLLGIRNFPHEFSSDHSFPCLKFCFPVPVAQPIPSVCQDALQQDAWGLPNPPGLSTGGSQ